jgi:hypothetical protein
MSQHHPNCHVLITTGLDSNAGAADAKFNYEQQMTYVLLGGAV